MRTHRSIRRCDSERNTASGTSTTPSGRSADTGTVRRGPHATLAVWTHVDLSALLGVVAERAAVGVEADAAADLVLAGLAERDLEEHAASEAAAVSLADVERARVYLHDFRTRPVGLRELAACAHLSTSRLSHAFRAHFHISPTAYGLRLRTDEARRLLLCGRTLADAAAATGFADQSHFTRCFRRFVGPTPAAYAAVAGSFKTTTVVVR